MQRIIRTTASLPAAGLVTLSLAFFMAGLTRVDAGLPGQAEDRVFELFPEVTLVQPPDRWHPEPVEPVDPPEAVRLTVQSQSPEELTIDSLLVTLPPIDPPEIAPIQTAVIDRPESPVFRQAPVYPARAIERGLEGSCQVFFDLNTSGRPFNIRATDCTSPVFSRAAETAVRGWRYEPRIVNGQPVERRDRSVMIEFSLEN